MGVVKKGFRNAARTRQAKTDETVLLCGVAGGGGSYVLFVRHRDRNCHHQYVERVYMVLVVTLGAF